MMGRAYRMSVSRVWYVVAAFVLSLSVVSWRAVAAIQEIAVNTSSVSLQMEELMLDPH